MIEEKNIKFAPIPITLEKIEIISNQMKSCICKIKGGNTIIGTGFFCYIPFRNEKIPILLTNYDILTNESIKENKRIELSLNNDKQIKIIDIDDKRIIHICKKYELIAIQIKNKDNINDFLELDDILLNDTNDSNLLKGKSIYIPQYPKRENIVISFGIINEINVPNITHFCNTKYGSSGSPILNLETNKIIGIHKNCSKRFNFNRGCFLKGFLNSFYYDLNVFLPNNKNTNSNYSNYNSKLLTNYTDINTPFISTFFGHDLLTNKDKNYNINSYTNDNKKTPFGNNISKNKYHFMCHKCKQFPVINFQSANSVNILCGCSSDLENKELQYLFKNYIVLENNNFKLNQCNLHNQIYNYYCTNCFKDICKDCLIKNKEHSKHNLKYFDTIKFDINIKIEKLKDKYNISDEIFDKDFNIIDGQYTICKLLKILINDFNKSPCKNLFKTFENLYNFIFGEAIEITNEKDLDIINQSYIINSIIIKNQDFNVKKLENLNLNNLVILSLRNNNINDLSSLQKYKLEELKFLDLSNNYIDDKAIQILEQLNLNSLNFLNLSSNKIKDFSIFNIVKGFYRLKECFIGNNIFDENTINNVDEILELSNLQEIDLSDGIFTKKSIQIINKFEFINLRKLYLNNNILESLNFLKDLKCHNLEEISLNNINIKKIENFNNLKSLKYIEMKKNQLADIDDIINLIDDLTNLQKINLKGNNFDFKDINKLNILKKKSSKRDVKIILLN